MDGVVEDEEEEEDGGGVEVVVVAVDGDACCGWEGFMGGVVGTLVDIFSLSRTLSNPLS